MAAAIAAAALTSSPFSTTVQIVAFRKSVTPKFHVQVVPFGGGVSDKSPLRIVWLSLFQCASGASNVAWIALPGEHPASAAPAGAPGPSHAAR
jgi:hypothetical protein